MTEIQQAYLNYLKAGLKCLPCNKDKSPMSKRSWLEEFSVEDFKNAEYIGIKGGSYSDGLICLDFDNHQKDATQNLKNYLEIPEVKEIYENYKLPIESSQSGGYHLLFRVDKKIENKKLASKDFNGKPDCFIEIKAQNGYFVSAPSPGYKVIRNNILDIQKITVVDASILIDNAISMNEVFKTIKLEYEGAERPGDLFNKQSSQYEIENILKEAGWKNAFSDKWTRPGKKTGISGSLKSVKGQLLFYCFSSNASPFEERVAYTPFQILSILKYNGDFKECAKNLPKPEKTIIEQKVLSVTEIEKLLNSSLIDTTVHIERPPVILSIKEVSGNKSVYKRLFTLGNFSVIIGKAKSKKTFLLSLIVSFLIKKKNFADKFLNELEIGKNLVLWFDTEQGVYDSHNVAKRIEKLAGKSLNFRYYNLRPFSPKEREQIIEHSLKLFGKETGLLIIDGIADLANAINDELEASRISSFLLRVTKEYNIHIINILHQNKNDNFATGHLGSSLMKKAEIILSTKSIEDYVEVNCDMSRGQDFIPFRFTIDEDGLPQISEIYYDVVKTKKGVFDAREDFELNVSSNLPMDIETNKKFNHELEQEGKHFEHNFDISAMGTDPAPF